MRITESHLRQIIRQTILEEQIILEEQNRIDESSMMAQFKQAARAALISVGIALSPALVNIMAKTMYEEYQNPFDNQGRIAAHRRSVENEKGVDQLLGHYGQAIYMAVSGNPTLKRGSQIRKLDAVMKAEQALVDAGVSQEEIDQKFKVYYGKATMYSY